MFNDIEKLYNIAKKQSRMILGLMSGTSLDGLDIVLCQFTSSGKDTKVKVLQFATVNYTEDVKQKIRLVFAQQQVDFMYLTALNPWLASLQAEMILNCLQKWGIKNTEVDIIASHGQTVMHAPVHQHHIKDFPDSTLQIGDGDHIAVKTGIITISDFRQKHLAAGGEGAPLAVYGDFILFSDEVQNRIMLNLGGIANFTYLPAGYRFEQVFVTDTGPGNTLMDAYVQKYLNISYDQSGNLASVGIIHNQLLSALKNHHFFKLPFPKTTGPELFNLRFLENAINLSDTQKLPFADVMATLNRFTAETIAEAILNTTKSNKCSIYLSGGGMHNEVLTQHLAGLLSEFRLNPIDELGFNGDAKEAVLFAVLANETLSALPPDYGSSAGFPQITMGKISLPN